MRRSMPRNVVDITTRLPEWILRASYNDAPDETVVSTTGLLLKSITGMVAGSRELLAKKLITYP